VVIDIGAHAGQFSKLFARMAPAGRVYAFEPSAYARSVMAPAVAFSRLRNITLVPFGLGEHAARLVLHTPLKPSSSLGFGTAHLGAGAGPTVDQIIEVTTLDAFARSEGLNRLDFVKADIEGWELKALKGGEATLRRFLPPLYLEVDDALMGRAGDTPEALFGWLAMMGYRAFTTPGLAPVGGFCGGGDYLFVAEGKSSPSRVRSPISALTFNKSGGGPWPIMMSSSSAAGPAATTRRSAPDSWGSASPASRSARPWAGPA
jgi:FkbM family methyltransferase